MCWRHSDSTVYSEAPIEEVVQTSEILHSRVRICASAVWAQQSFKKIISENLQELQTEAWNILFLCSLKRKISNAHFQSGKNLAITLEHLSLTKHSETFLSKQSQLAADWNWFTVKRKSQQNIVNSSLLLNISFYYYWLIISTKAIYTMP